MAKVTFASDEDVYHLLDPDCIEQQLSHINVNFIFSCLNSDNWTDDNWIGADGTPYHIIKLPYDLVKTMNKEQVRALMLQKALERLQQAA